MKFIFTFIALFSGAFLSAQDINLDGTTTRAVVIGISDYQDVAIPDLRFADRDAEAFANFLRSPAGGSLDGDHLKLLTNEKATMAQFAKSLDWLWETCKEGDEAIIYFSGHGDVEKKSLTQPGFLLCWDAPARVYMAGGAFALPMLQEVISTLSTQNKAKVVVITDACHSAKLAGSEIYGAQLTGQNLARQYANEIKLLSCQPNEYSIEGEQWGGGRGAFSYYLVDALYGMADANNDLSVNLKEVGRYLEDHVTVEVAPVSQNPKVVGNPSEPLASVDANLLAELRSGKTSQIQLLYPIENRGMEDDVLAGVDTTTLELYHLFQKALKDKVFLVPNAGEPATACADAYYERLMAEPKLTRLHSTMTRNYAAALQDDAQQTLNALLESDPYEQNKWQYSPDKYIRYPDYLAKAIELLGEGHYMYKTLMAKKFFFEAKSAGMSNHSTLDNAVFVDSINRKVRNLLHLGLKFDPHAAYLYCALENSFYANAAAEADSFFYYHDRALELSPSWMLPRYQAMNNYLLNKINPNWEEVEKYALKALAVKPDSYLMLEKLAWLYQRMFKKEEAIQVCQRMIELRPDLPNGYNTIGTTYRSLREYDRAQSWSLKALEIDSSTLDWTVYNLAGVFIRKREYDKLFSLTNRYPNPKDGLELLIWRFSDALEQVHLFDLSRRVFDYGNEKYSADDPGDIASNLVVEGTYQLKKGQIDQAEAAFHRAFQVYSGISVLFVNAYSGLAQAAALKHLADSSEFYFQKAIGYYPELLSSWSGSAYANARYHYARFLLDQNRPADAEAQLLKAEEIDPRNPLNYYGMAALYAHQMQQNKAIDWLAKALEWYYPDYEEIMAEPLFQETRKTKRFKALMKQYFPNGSDKPLVEKLAREYMPEIFK